MATKDSAPGISAVTRDLLERIANGPLAGRLRGSLRRRHPRRSPDEIDEAFQEAYARALRSCPVEDEPAIYAWLWRTMHNILVDRLRLLAREPLVSNHCETLERQGEPAAAPDSALLQAEQERDLRGLFGELACALAPRQRAVLGLYARGLKRPQVAEQLGVRERIVKRDLERILDRARALLVERCGGGCAEGSRLVWRFAFGLASSQEASRAQLHLVACARCQEFLGRLGSWREAAAAAVPVPAVDQAGPGVAERSAHALAELADTVRAKVAGPASSARQQLADGATQLKAQSAAVSSRALDPTPLAGMRPGAAAAAISTCLALGAGATYCVDQGFTALPDVAKLIEPDSQRERKADHRKQQGRVAQVEPAPVPPEAAPAPTIEPPPAPQPTVVEAAPPAPAPAPEDEQFDPAAAAATDLSQQSSPSPGAAGAASAAGVGEFLGGP